MKIADPVFTWENVRTSHYDNALTAANLNVIGKPDPPIDPRVIVSRSHEMLLQWTPPQFDGGSDLVNMSYAALNCDLRLDQSRSATS